MRIQVTFLGTGTSSGVPMIGCQCRVCQSPDPKDKRARLIALTDRGKRLMETVFPRHVKHMSEFFSVFDDEEKRQLIYLMKKLTTKNRK